MADAWVHAVIDLIAYGRSYFDLHKKKDKPHEFFGSNHRIVNHKWYQAYRRLWNFRDPFPSWLKESIRILGNEEGADRAEEQMAWVDHDYIDRTWMFFWIKRGNTVRDFLPGYYLVPIFLNIGQA